MARIANKVMVMGLAGLMAVQGFATTANASSGASLFNNPSPVSTGSAFNLLQLPNVNQINMLGAAGLGQMNLGQMLTNAFSTAITSKLLGSIPGLGAIGQQVMAMQLSNTIGQAMGLSTATQGLGSLGSLGSLTGMTGLSGLTGTNTSLVSSLLGGGIQGGLTTGTLNFGGLVNTALNSVVQAGATALVNEATQALTGGIQSSSGSTANTGTTATTTASVNVLNNNATAVSQDVTLSLSSSATVNTTSVNYGYGQLDAELGYQPNSGFLMSSNTWDTNYMAGYKAALAASMAVSSR